MNLDPRATAHYDEVLALLLFELGPFVRRKLRVFTCWLTVYWGFNFGVPGVLAYRIYRVAPSLDTVLTGLGQGFLVFFLPLLPLHEGTHAAVYKLLGAPRVTFGAEWHRLVPYADDEGFCLNFRQFACLALAPFVVINSGLLAALGMAPALRLAAAQRRVLRRFWARQLLSPAAPPPPLHLR